jgi:hypothetical protein
MAVISTTIAPTSHLPQADAAPTLVMLDDALAVVSRKGYDASDYATAGVPDEDTWEGTTLRVLLGVRTPIDNFDQRAFLFLSDRYVGTDTKLPSARISLVKEDDKTVTVEYWDPLSDPTVALSCDIMGMVGRWFQTIPFRPPREMLG